jgi:hypothetical protein
MASRVGASQESEPDRRAPRPGVSAHFARKNEPKTATPSCLLAASPQLRSHPRTTSRRRPEYHHMGAGVTDEKAVTIPGHNT